LNHFPPLCYKIDARMRPYMYGLVQDFLEI